MTVPNKIQRALFQKNPIFPFLLLIIRDFLSGPSAGGGGRAGPLPGHQPEAAVKHPTFIRFSVLVPEPAVEEVKVFQRVITLAEPCHPDYQNLSSLRSQLFISRTQQSVSSVLRHNTIIGGSRGTPGTLAPGPMFFIFMPFFSGKMVKLIGWRPILLEILDLPLTVNENMFQIKIIKWTIFKIKVHRSSIKPQAR